MENRRNVWSPGNLARRPGRGYRGGKAGGIVLDDTVAVDYMIHVRDIAYSRTALKALTRMPGNWRTRIRDKIRAYADDPASQANNVVSMKGQDRLVRLRVGDWRVIMRDGEVIHVLYVTSRGSAYRE